MRLPNTVKYSFFSPTGNTEKVCRALACGLQEQLGLPANPTALSWLRPADRAEEDRQLFTATDLAVVGFPVYAGRLPNLLLPFARKLRGDNTPAIAAVTYGFRHFDDALAELAALLQEQGFTLLGALAVPCAHSFSDRLGAGHPDAAELASLAAVGRDIASALQAGQPVNPASVPFKHNPPIYFQPRRQTGEPINILKVKPKVKADRCLYCGRCAAVCPMQVINPADPADVKSPCIKCSACRKICPTGAIYFDDPGFLYHIKDLEEHFNRPLEPLVLKFINTDPSAVTDK